MMVTETAALITAGVGAFTAAGGGIRWLVMRIDKRFEKVEEALAECQERESRQKDINNKYLIVIELLWQDVARHARGKSDTLDRAKELLTDLKEETPKP